MKQIAEELEQIIGEYSAKISSLPEEVFSAKPLPNKWSKKEVLGHLIDSAHNNLRRFITGQYETLPPHIIYDQDFWVNVNGYNLSKKEDIILLWRLMNERICVVLRTMPADNYSKMCNTGKTTEQLHSLQFLAEDYVKHLKHHINQIIPRSFDVVYS
ncbi:MAG: DinB family protein [Marivirga sp.]|nr:DinB family protein [Marivirga sp.]